MVLAGWLVLDTVLVALLKLAAKPVDWVVAVVGAVAPEPNENPPTEAVAVVTLPNPKVELAAVVALVFIPPSEKVVVLEPPRDNPVLDVLVTLRDVAVDVFEAVVPPSENPRPTAGVLLAVIGATAATEAIGVPRVRLPPGLAPNPKPVGAEVDIAAPNAGAAVVFEGAPKAGGAEVVAALKAEGALVVAGATNPPKAGVAATEVVVADNPNPPKAEGALAEAAARAGVAALEAAPKAGGAVVLANPKAGTALVEAVPKAGGAVVEAAPKAGRAVVEAAPKAGRAVVGAAPKAGIAVVEAAPKAGCVTVV